MEKEAYHQHFELEDRYWWFLGRKKAIQNLLSPVLDGKESRKTTLSILDVGCGTGGMLPFFEEWGKVWGLDLSFEALTYCRKRSEGVQLIQGSALRLPFPDETFDLIAACDLISHKTIDDDLTALREFSRVCKKGGYLLLTDSAFDCLRGAHDRFFHGIRRYTTKTLKPKIEVSGFSVERLSYMNMALFPLIYLWRKLRVHQNGSDLKAIPPPLNRCLTRLFTNEAQLLKRWNLPFGTSIICLAEKKDTSSPRKQLSETQMSS